MALNFLEGLTECGHQAILALLEDGVELKPRQNLRIFPSPRLAIHRKGPAYRWLALLRYPYFLARTWTLARRFRPQIVITFCLESLLAVAFARTLTREFRWHAMIGSDTYRGVELRYPRLQKLARFGLHRLYSQPDRLLAGSEGLKRQLQDLYRFGDDRLLTLYNPVDTERVKRLCKLEPSPLCSRPYLLAAGRLIAPKGFDLLLQAFQLAESRLNPDLQLLILGAGPELNRLCNLRDSLGLNGRVHLPGFQANPWSHMARAEAVVVPSLSEGFSLVTAEALTCGVPVLVSDCPFGPREIVAQGAFGEVVPCGDAKALADKLVELLHDPKRRTELSRLGPERAVRFSRQRIISDYCELLVAPC